MPRINPHILYEIGKLRIMNKKEVPLMPISAFNSLMFAFLCLLIMNPDGARAQKRQIACSVATTISANKGQVHIIGQCAKIFTTSETIM